jgi:hypothetical protein
MVLNVEAREFWSHTGDPTIGWYCAWAGQDAGCCCCWAEYAGRKAGCWTGGCCWAE